LVDLRQPCSLDLVCGLPISRLGLIDKVLAPASVKERPVPQWQRQKAKGKVERINPNCQRKDCRSIRRSFCLGGALAFGGQQRCLEVASRSRHVLTQSMRRVGLIDITVGNATRLGASQRSTTRRCASHHIATQRANRWGHPEVLARLAQTVTLKRLWLRDGHVQRAHSLCACCVWHNKKPSGLSPPQAGAVSLHRVQRADEGKPAEGWVRNDYRSGQLPIRAARNRHHSPTAPVAPALGPFLLGHSRIQNRPLTR
jgi:hypothetical protein